MNILLTINTTIDAASSVEIAGSVCFFIAVLHTFSVKYFQKISHQYNKGSLGENFFHFLGEVEVVFGLWAAIFIFIYTFLKNGAESTAYLENRSFTEPMLVFVLMTICSTNPILFFANNLIQKISNLLPFGKSISFFISTMIIGPILGSIITEPAAMTVTALILLDRFYKNNISEKLKYAILGLLFVSVSIGGALTPFAAPPVLMVSKIWDWDILYMLTHFGWKAFLSILISTLFVVYKFRIEFSKMPFHENKKNIKNIPFWITGLHLLFLVFIILNHQHAVVFISVFLFFMGLAAVTQEYQAEINLKSPLLVAFFLGGLVVLGGMQSWWLSPLLSSFSANILYVGSICLTAVTDNAAITYLGSQVLGLSEFSKFALVSGSVVGGGLTVIANAPNPAGYSILNTSFGQDGISAVQLFKSAITPTIIAGIIFWFL